MDNLAPKATGCLIKSDDMPRLMASISAFGAQFGCGAGTAVIGLTLPHLINRYDISVTEIGTAFFLCPGVGFIIGLLLSYHIRQTMTMKLSKISLSCISIFFAGIIQLLIMWIRNIQLIVIFNFLQFTAFGCVEGFSTIALFEMWGQRIQPWIYSKTFAYAFGGLIPSLLFRKKGFNEIYILSSVMCFFPLIGLICDFIYTTIRNKKIKDTSTIISSSSLSPSSSSYCILTNNNNNNNYFDDHSQQSHRNSIPTILEEDFMSSEFVLLELAFENVTIQQSIPRKIKEAVINILDATEYCNVTIQQRKDPYFEPDIIKTLSYATIPIVKKLKEFQNACINPPISLFPPRYSLFFGLLGFIYMSLMTIFTGWLPWYILQLNHSSSFSSFSSSSSFDSNHHDDDYYSHQEFNFLNHWNVLTFYYICSLLGCTLSIPLSIWLSTTTIFRFNLLCLTISSTLFLYCSHDTLHSLHIFLYGSIVMGLGLSSIFPSLVTILHDYNYTGDDLSITIILLISSIGSIICPVLMSYYIIPIYGYQLIPYICGILGILLVSFYFIFHISLQYSEKFLHFHFQNNQKIQNNKNEYFRISKPYNTYQRAQTMLFDINRFKFTQSSSDLQTLYQTTLREEEEKNQKNRDNNDKNSNEYNMSDSYELIQYEDIEENIGNNDDNNNLMIMKKK